MYKLLPVLLLLLASCNNTQKTNNRISSSKPTTDKELSFLNLPEGFTISVYADDVKNARSLCLSPKGTLFVGTRSHGSVYALKDTDGDNKIDKKYTLATGLHMPNGVAFKNGDLYVAEVSRVLRFNDIENNLADLVDYEVINDDYPKKDHHGWKYIAFGPDEKLYIPVGAPCNICESNNEIFNTITRYAPKDNMHFGYPYCHQGDFADPKLGSKHNCDEFTPPAQKLGPHVAALGMEFYKKGNFPDSYNNTILIAEHGSWNRTTPIGYRITKVTLNGNKATDYDVFIDGFRSQGTVHGRPVDLEWLPDGSLLMSDDHAGKIYRVSYSE